MNSKLYLTLGIILLGLPLCYAFDCSSLDHESYCEEIMNLDLNEEEREYLLAGLMNEPPEHEEVRDWNLNPTSAKFSVSTDKQRYVAGEEILLSIEPPHNYIVEYADQRFEAHDTVTLEAHFAYNRITVTSEDGIIFTYIHIKNEEPLDLAFSLTLFGTTNYVLIALIKKYWGILL